MVRLHALVEYAELNLGSIGPSQAEQLLRVTSAIAAELIKAHEAGESVSLNEARARLSKKYGYSGVPRYGAGL